MSDLVREIGEETFTKEVLESPLPVIVDFWEKWCGPCQMFAPIIEKLAKEFQGEVRFLKISIDKGENRKVAVEYDVRSIPLLIGFKNGKPVARLLGYRPKTEVKKFIERFLSVT